MTKLLGELFFLRRYDLAAIPDFHNAVACRRDAFAVGADGDGPYAVRIPPQMSQVAVPFTCYV